ncbi:MAG: 16S rRNA (cytosine(1402)-N(4))-methyltransferase RsmH [Chloroflexi bacterium]|nr:16S rRNA (cytosine(1402)-N(4))-methyltransferase RsmH [Chloroflexota bacterium]
MAPHPGGDGTLARHLSVLWREALEHLAVRPGGRYIDATVGAGGLAAGILAAAQPEGRLLALDADEEAICLSRARLQPWAGQVALAHSNFRRLAEVAKAHRFGEADGIVLDLGLSSMQLDTPRRGFSFQSEGPLDMRFDPRQGPSAADLVNQASEAELADILWQYGEERASRRIARAIVQERPILQTRQLADLVARVLPRQGKIHPATRTFQALRIATNDELAALVDVLPQAVALLTPGGRLVVISFHSLEDRIVKRFFQQEARGCLCPPELPVCQCQHKATLRILTAKPVRPSAEEARANPRSRSARLRAAERRSD